MKSIWLSIPPFSQSANVFDSYGEVLDENGKVDKAVANYKRAVSLTEKYTDQRLELLKKNLQSVKKKYSN